MNYFKQENFNQVFLSAPTSGAGAPLGGQLGQGSGMFTSPGMQSLMGQMRDNPTLMSQMMSAPYMQVKEDFYIFVSY